ncbi:hypothetical protein ACQKWADRAFT_279119 [Trichoderma austrokoningii]
MTEATVLSGTFFFFSFLILFFSKSFHPANAVTWSACSCSVSLPCRPLSLITALSLNVAGKMMRQKSPQEWRFNDSRTGSPVIRTESLTVLWHNTTRQNCNFLHMLTATIAVPCAGFHHVGSFDALPTEWESLPA